MAWGDLGGQTRTQLDNPFQAILSEFDAIAATTAFGSFNPLADDTLQVSLAVGTTADDTITVSGVDATRTAIGVGSLDIATASAAANGLATLDTVISELSALLARNQIIQESAIAVIGQADSNLSIVLRLLE